METEKVKPVYSVIDPNAREDTLAALKNLAVEKLLRSIEAERPR